MHSVGILSSNIRSFELDSVEKWNKNETRLTYKRKNTLYIPKSRPIGGVPFPTPNWVEMNWHFISKCRQLSIQWNQHEHFAYIFFLIQKKKERWKEWKKNSFSIFIKSLLRMWTFCMNITNPVNGKNMLEMNITYE